ncbi:hypothetical protein G4G28_18345 [Massilia sp. Dwa41.01b]|uniref:hypothetical protein n=1 Tax=unclassified Massilia TaxID=2609279 RepID=UPI001600A03F|nr:MULTISPECIES: hypothetical protein [unclassified Massilia]QNA89969.1 hypothetical protein G4G28_18345 [Massilia sp. Dwa41.01b]QNB00852.1 hypothetical protein G4G31_21915 [Massilia sp. Se16.2.3]
MSTTLISPIRFATIQLAVRLIPVAVIVAFVFGAIAITWPEQSDLRGSDNIFWRIVVILFYVGSTGGIGLAYAAQMLGLNAQGLISTPRVPWTVSLDASTLSIRARRYASRIDMDEVERLVLINDDNWDQIKGIEDKCLAISLKSRALRIIVPGTYADDW